tara:strand:- start:3016 stop:3402 length:387 start_codon:yes stop_codon:yes gene_type:complete
MANEFTRRSPEGASYDIRTHYFNKEKGRVLVRPQFEGLSNADRCSLVGLKHVDNNPEWKQAQIEWQAELDKRNQLRIKKAQSRTTYNVPARSAYVYYYIVPSYQQWFNYYNRCYNGYYNHRHYYNGRY